MDFDATESSLLLALEGGCAMEDIYIRPSQLKIKLHKPSENRTEIVSYSVAELLHLPPEVIPACLGTAKPVTCARGPSFLASAGPASWLLEHSPLAI